MTRKKNYSITLCLICQNCFGKCAWSKWFEPVDGWEAVVDYGRNGKILHAWVGWCPKFVADRGLYDIITQGDETKGRTYLMEQYGYLTRLRYATIRYRLLNDYERSEKDEDRANNIRKELQMRQANAKIKGTMQHALPHKMEVQR